MHPTDRDDTVPLPSSRLDRRQLLNGIAIGAAAMPLVAACSSVPGNGVREATFVRDGAIPPPVPAGGADCAGYAAQSVRAPLRRVSIPRRQLGPRDVGITILYCGVCHSDIHQVANDWNNTLYPCVPGHEIVGRVAELGREVRSFAVGDAVAVGAIVDSCGGCEPCRNGLEQYCEGPRGATATYNGPYQPDGTNTFGGYSSRIVVAERFVHAVPAALTKHLAAVGPLLCAGITTWSPLRRSRFQPGQRAAIVGMGGLGHMAVKFAKAMGGDVTVVSTSPDKEADSKEFGASDFVLANDVKGLRQRALSYDLVIDTVPTVHDVHPLVDLAKRDGTYVMVGLLVPFSIDNRRLAFHRRSLASSTIGGTAETKEMLDFCAEHQILPAIETIEMPAIDAAFANVQSGKVRYRYVVDIANSV